MHRMAAEAFHFKQFSVRHDRCAMKVGTDGVLLGAWAGSQLDPFRILDVGTGSGLIALMLAQRFPNAQIDGIEINESAASQARKNAENSPFSNQITIQNGDFFQWESNFKYDLVVCNPPFYAHAHPAANEARATARHGVDFNLKQFLYRVPQFLSAEGSLAMILPTSVFESLPSTTLHIRRIDRVFPVPHKAHHRILAEWNTSHQTPTESKIIIENHDRHDYHPLYVALTKPFYLKF